MSTEDYFALRNEIDREFFENQQDDEDEDASDDEEDDQGQSAEPPTDAQRHALLPALADLQPFQAPEQPSRPFDSAAAGYGHNHGTVQTYTNSIPLPYSADFVNSSHMQKRLLCIDSRHRDENDVSTTHEFGFTMQTPLKNVVRVRLSSAEIPNTFYDFNAEAGNTRMDISGQSLMIPDGDYASVQDVTLALTQLLMLHVDPSAQATVDPRTRRVTITCPHPMDISMAVEPFADRLSDFGLGYVLGFRQPSYENVTSITGEAMATLPSHPYLYLQINDWDCVHKQYETGTLRAFARLVNKAAKGEMIFDDGQNGVTKEYVFRQPVSLHRLLVRIVNRHGEALDLNGVDCSFALEVTQLNNSHVHETYRNMQFGPQEVASEDAQSE